VLPDQLVQRRDAGHALRQPAPRQPAARLILDLDVVMGLRPVVPDEQHLQHAPRLDRSSSSPGKTASR